MPWRIDLFGYGRADLNALYIDDYIWLRLSSAPSTTQMLCRSDVDGVDSQA